MRRSRPGPGRGGLALAGGRAGGGAGRRELTYAAGGRGGAAACGAGPETRGPDPLPAQLRTLPAGEAAPPCPGWGAGAPGRPWGGGCVPVSVPRRHSGGPVLIPTGEQDTPRKSFTILGSGHLERPILSLGFGSPK